MENKKHIFTPLERKTFVEISKQYSRIIENKDTDSATLQSKNLAWDKIMTEFNTSPNATVQATSKQLRRLWMNLKQRKRTQSQAIQRQHCWITEEPSTINTGSGDVSSQQMQTIFEREYKDRQHRANEIHELEMMLLREKIREAKAKADLAELLLGQQD